MSRNVKILLIVAGSLLAICCLLGVAAAVLLPRLAENVFTQDPQKARQVASQIADYSLPAGYVEQFSMDVLTTKMVMIMRPDGSGLAYMLMQVSQAGASREQMEAQMQQSFQQQFQRSAGQMTLVGTRQVVIKGQPVTLNIYEGKAQNGAVAARQVLGLFPGKGGTAMVMVYGPIADWNDATVDQFLQSIR